jgi:hypothetical protein
MYHVLWPIGFGGAFVHSFKDATIPFSPLARQEYRLDDLQIYSQNQPSGAWKTPTDRDSARFFSWLDLVTDYFILPSAMRNSWSINHLAAHQRPMLLCKCQSH